ncbi:hypothetical protein AB0442_06955 [Kitasatospora sp. NPDC085895]|uniref:hypothetical protein n=1 Tax=Kitasatospora sp. NPDC085895 TaxID=3155057 RepID=UPI00344C70BE
MSIRRRAYPEAHREEHPEARRGRARRDDRGTGPSERGGDRERAADREGAGSSTAPAPAAGRDDDGPEPPAADTAAP